jgi:hypothetical protein
MQADVVDITSVEDWEQNIKESKACNKIYVIDVSEAHIFTFNVAFLSF